MAAWRTWVVLGALLVCPTVQAQKQHLAEAPKSGECFQIDLETTLSGSMKINRDGKPQALPISAKNQHLFLEKILSENKGIPRKVARHYHKAQSVAQVGSDTTQRTLRSERRRIVAQRLEDTLLVYSPAGPLTRMELEVTAEHFDTMQLTALLPDKEVALEESWKLSNLCVQALCQFEGLITHDLTGKLKEVKEGAAIIAIEGKANGIESGAIINLTITATARYDLLQHRLVQLEWKQKDIRDQGPASPASEVESTTILKRTRVEEEPKELSRVVLATIPSEDDPPGLLKQLSFKEAQGKYTFLYPREWHVVGQTDSHVVLRLLERGDFVAQATITNWKKMEAGQHLSGEEFRKLTTNSPGWEVEEIVEAGEIPSDDGRWAYRVTAKGALDGIKVVQNFFLLAGPAGDQLIITFTMKPTNVTKIGTRDLALVNSIEFKKDK